MTYKLTAWLSREENDIDLSQPFSQNLDGMDKYTFQGGFHIYAIEEDENYNEISRETVANVRGIFFDENKILNDGQDIIEIADMYDGDTLGAISTLIESNLYRQDIDENKMFDSLFSCYIEHVYVQSKYRKQGIGQFIFNNFDRISSFCFNAPIHCLVICPQPQEVIKDGELTILQNKDDPDDFMLNIMIEVLNKNDFKKLGTSEFYAKNCAL